MSDYSPSAPAARAAAITPSDSAGIARTRGVYVGGNGNLAVQFAEDGSTVTLIGVVAGVVYPIQVVKVLETGTTATNLVALYP